MCIRDRGIPAQIFSDNGTNLRRAGTIVHDLYKLFQQDEFQQPLRTSPVHINSTGKKISTGRRFKITILFIFVLLVFVYKFVASSCVTL